MKDSLTPERNVRWRRVRQASFVDALIAFAVAACTDDAIVYPNRNTEALAGSAGVLAAAGEGGENSVGGSGAGGSGTGGSGTGGSGTVNEGGDSGANDGPRCGDGIVQPPEECDDGNPLSGDGCSYDCRSECETCESKVCSIPTVYDYNSDKGSAYDDCYAVKGIILKGPAATVPRAEVCRELVDCIRKENCAQKFGDNVADFRRCWCDVDFNTSTSAYTVCSNPTTFVPGKCAGLFQDASEGDTAQDVVQGLTRTSVALGAALRLLTGCDSSICPEECMPGFFGAPVVATITEDLTATANAAGESQLGDLTADAQRAVSGADAAIVSHLALCQDGADQPGSELAFLATPDMPADADGRVLWSEALATQYCYSGVDTNLANLTNKNAGGFVALATLTGQQLYDALTVGLGGAATLGTVRTPFYVSGISYTWQDAVAPALPKIVEVRKNGVPIDMSATFTVALSEFLEKGSLRTIVGANAAVVPNSGPITLLGGYLAQLPQPVAAPPLERITLLTPSGG